MTEDASFKLRKVDAVPVKQDTVGGITVWTQDGVGSNAKPLSPEQKLHEAKVDAFLTAKAEVRSATCWFDGCPNLPRVWVREVQYDLRGEKSINRGTVSSDDYDGPIPGFCISCETRGAEGLAQAVYISRPEMQWGLRPLRWFVIYTDGTKTGGMCAQLDTTPYMPSVVENFQPGTDQREAHTKLQPDSQVITESLSKGTD